MLWAISKTWSYSGVTKTGIAPERIKPEIAEECTFRGKIILSPVPQVAIIAASTPQVEPLTKNQECSAPNAAAASC